jgi:chorismate mutase
LRVGTSGDYAPFSLDGAGFDVEVAERFAADQGLRLEWVRFGWPELEERLRAGDFDLAMSGVTWRPDRAVAGFMTRAVASGGPCLLGAGDPRRIGVNRGGFLEGWARARFPDREIVATDDNRALGALLEESAVDAVVTDSFELPRLARPGLAAICAPRRERKVYWVSPARADDLGPALERWLAEHEPDLERLRVRWLGGPAPRSDLDHLIDLLARRLALMPEVAFAKRAQRLPIEDPAQEERVLAGAERAALRSGLDPERMRALFRTLIELGKRVQDRAADASGRRTLDLAAELRPELARLSPRIAEALSGVSGGALRAAEPARLAPLEALLTQGEITSLLEGAAAVREAPGLAPARTRVFQAPPAGPEGERYSAWFADAAPGVLYFGLSPFWDLYWSSGGDATAELRQPGDHLIGRFDLDAERFLPTLRARAAAPDVRGSVWDVLVHPNGRIYYTTLFEEIGWIAPEGGAAASFEGIGSGFNELALGPRGELYATRYAERPEQARETRSGSVVVLTPDGELLRELRVPSIAGEAVAPKSLAVDPRSGEVWINTDSFAPDGSLVHETFRFAADGRILERRRGPPELQFAYFDAGGRGWFAEAEAGRLALRVREANGVWRVLWLGAIDSLDFVQDIKPMPRASGDDGVVLALWSGRTFTVEPRAESFVCRELRLERPPRCAPPDGRSLVYTAVVHRSSIYATLACGPTLLRASLGEAVERLCARP